MSEKITKILVKLDEDLKELTATEQKIETSRKDFSTKVQDLKTNIISIIDGIKNENITITDDIISSSNKFIEELSQEELKLINDFETESKNQDYWNKFVKSLDEKKQSLISILEETKGTLQDVSSNYENKLKDLLTGLSSTQESNSLKLSENLIDHLGSVVASIKNASNDFESDTKSSQNNLNESTNTFLKEYESKMNETLDDSIQNIGDSLDIDEVDLKTALSTKIEDVHEKFQEGLYGSLEGVIDSFTMFKTIFEQNIDDAISRLTEVAKQLKSQIDEILLNKLKELENYSSNYEEKFITFMNESISQIADDVTSKMNQTKDKLTTDAKQIQETFNTKSSEQVEAIQSNFVSTEENLTTLMKNISEKLAQAETDVKGMIDSSLSESKVLIDETNDKSEQVIVNETNDKLKEIINLIGETREKIETIFNNVKSDSDTIQSTLQEDVSVRRTSMSTQLESAKSSTNSTLHGLEETISSHVIKFDTISKESEAKIQELDKGLSKDFETMKKIFVRAKKAGESITKEHKKSF